jgi:ribosomal protein S6--L-glutamate ligase
LHRRPSGSGKRSLQRCDKAAQGKKESPGRAFEPATIDAKDAEGYTPHPMRVVILSRSAKIPSTQRLVDVARGRGHQVRVLDPMRVEMHLDGRSATLFYKRKRLRGCDVVIPRIGQSVNVYGLAVLNQYAVKGIPQMNSPTAIAQARNKMRSLQLLSANGVDIPSTVMARDARDLKDMVKLVGGVPVLVKLLQGQDKSGMMVCETLQSLEATLEAVLGLGHNLIVQRYVRKPGQDHRVMVVGGQVVASVRRIARRGRMAHTLLRGARLEPCELSAAQQKAAVTAASLMGLEVAAVDLLDVKGSPRVFEVNASPAITRLEQATGVDIAGRIIDRAEALAGRGNLPAEGLARKTVKNAVK